MFTYLLQALVYDILPSTTAVFSYAIAGPENCQLTSSFLLVLAVVSLLQTTQIKQGVGRQQSLHQHK